MYSVNYIFLWLTLFSVSRLQNIVLSIKKLRSIGGEEEKREIKEAGEGKRIKENLKIENELLKTGGRGRQLVSCSVLGVALRIWSGQIESKLKDPINPIL